MTEADALDKAQFLVDHWLYIVMALAGSIGLYFRVPPTINWLKVKVPVLLEKLKNSVKTIKVDVPTPILPPEKPDVIVLIHQMVESLPVIKDEALHKQAVEACVSFSEAVIREAGLVKSEDQ